ncbi:hypothetical protein J2W28_006949 [Variovorax boronicumulans]|uniref:hypothetical protein n=1 Tax=Variovorax boronicumulans TaxID=436515 RepID=UPI002788930F|nr:hypothetical protein [Variovorax boronicumulans]MDP9996472.1 hypothetical protein [Variovorax boronicumulans]MDQ0007770.1 hypothetical protein [Variovorax boronicumulans]
MWINVKTAVAAFAVAASALATAQTDSTETLGQTPAGVAEQLSWPSALPWRWTPQ